MNTEKILLVDDERAIRLAVRTALTREGMQVTEAADGSEALELLKKQQFHLVILDVMMEHVGGYDVLQAMRAAGDHTPVMCCRENPMRWIRCWGWALARTVI